MAENQPDSPEKQLLKLIENPKQPAIKVEEAKREGKRWFSINALKGRISFWTSFSSKKWFSAKKFTSTGFGLRQVNLTLKILIGILVLLFIYYVVEMSMNLKRASNLILQSNGTGDFEEAPEPEVKNLVYYQEKISGRNLFGVGEVPAPELKPGEEAPISKEQADRTKDFTLVGIAWSADPEAMIEDAKNKRTYFLKRGQPLDDEIKVVTIFKDKVILTVKGKEFELH